MGHLFVDLENVVPAEPTAEYQADESLVVRGKASEVDLVAKVKDTLDGAKKQLDEARMALEPLAEDARLMMEKRGQFVSRVQFQGTERRAIFTFTNAFSSLDPAMKEPLVKVLGPDVTEHLFQECERVSLVREKADELCAILKAAGKDPAEYLETDKSLQFASDFRRRRFQLRDQLQDHQNDALDMVMEQASNRPSLTTK